MESILMGCQENILANEELAIVTEDNRQSKTENINSNLT